ncbi:MAG: PAS domain S-box protein [Gemmatimonadota bacterium]|nr:PAS domain S-box protein [Gemmatimonadota bacterium]MDH5758463.1 PAS domain S-box protein [Gemmatimonadota bacterium]
MLAFIVILSFALGAVVSSLHWHRRRRTVTAGAVSLDANPLLTTAPDAVGVWSADQRLVEANPAFEEMSGWRLEEAVGMHVTAFLDPDHLGQFPLRSTDLLSQGPFRSRRLVVRKNGSRIWADIHTVRVGDRTVSIIRDVTERQEVEEALRRREAHFRHLVERGWDVILLLNGDTHLLWSSPSQQRVLGYAPMDNLGRAFTDFVHYEDHGQVQTLLAEVLTAPEAAGTLEARFIHSDGSLVWMEMAARNLLSHPDIASLVIHLRDVTPRKVAEEESAQEQKLISALMDSVPGIVYLFTPEGRLTRWNARLREFSGLTDDELSRVRALDFLPESSWGAAQESIRKALAGEVALLEADMIGPGGEQHPFLFTGTGIELDGNPFLLGIGISIGERKRLKSQLLRAQKLEAVGRLAGGLAHDFNNLLTAVLGNVELVQSALETETVDPGPHLEQIISAVDRASKLARQLLSFSRSDISEPRVVSPDRLLLELDQLLRRVLGRNIEMVTLVPEDVWNIHVDPGQLEQVLTNLAVNARDAMPDGGRLTISLHNSHLDHSEAELCGDIQPGEYVRFQVADTGSGMDEDTVSRIFEPFFSTKPSAKGTGLGLAVCYGIIRGARGCITVDSTVGTGTTFSVLLPRSLADITHDPATDHRVREVHGGSERILVVEDEPQVRLLMEESMRVGGYEVLIARSAEEGLDLFERLDRLPDLIVSDVMLPQKSGPEMVTRIREQYPDIPVLFVSGYTHTYLDTARIPGSDRVRFLPKPFRPRQLLNAIRDILDESEPDRDGGPTGT